LELEECEQPTAPSMANRTAAAIGMNQPVDLSLALAVVLLTGIDILNPPFA